MTVMEIPTETLDDGEIVLRRWRPEHVDLLHRAVSEAGDHLGRWLVWAVDGYGRQDAKEFIELTMKKWTSGQAFDYAIFAPDSEVAGGCGVMDRVGPGTLEIGYWLRPGYTGRGIMTKAVKLVTAEAFRIGAEWVEIWHDEFNTASSAIPARLGFTMIERRPADPPWTTACSGINQVWRLGARR
jgi:RimJ/RimL family protein N-acetyltransferase